MSLDPVTDHLRATMEHPFASRPLGGIDEEGFPIKEHNEFADAIRIAVEINFKRASKAATPALRDANMLCLQFWKDVATEKVQAWRDAREAAAIIFGNPPRTNIVLARMFDWQDWRITEKGYFCRQFVQFGQPVFKTEPRVQKPTPTWPHINTIAQSEMREALEEAWTGLVLGDPGHDSRAARPTNLFHSPGIEPKKEAVA